MAVLFIASNPPLSPLIGYVAKRLRGRRYVLLFLDMFPEAVERFAGVSPSSWVSRAWRALNGAAVRRADRVMTISPQLARTVAQYVPMVDVRIVPTWVDTERIRPASKATNEFARRYAQTEKLTVLYSGNMGQVHDLTVLPMVADRLRTVLDVHFVLIGQGVGRAPLEAACSRLGLPNVTFLPLQSEDVLPSALACADIAVVALAEGGEGVSMPSKTYYMMAAGAALLGLCAPRSDLAALIDDHECGVHVSPRDLEGVVEAILRLRADARLLAQYRRNGRRAAEQYYSLAVCVPQVMETIREVLG